MRKHKYGYGIVDKHGAPWWDESCVCKDRGPLQKQVDEMNYEGEHFDPREPYRVVVLSWISK